MQRTDGLFALGLHLFCQSRSSLAVVSPGREPTSKDVQENLYCFYCLLYLILSYFTELHVYLPRLANSRTLTAHHYITH